MRRCASVIAGVGADEHRRDRHHQPARDGASPGTDRPASRTAPAIVWQDRRTADAATSSPPPATCRSCASAPASCSTRTSPARRSSGSWQKRDIPIDDDLAIGTIDAWLIWNLTGGAVFATDVTNASRTMLCDIRTPAVGSRAVRPARTCRSPRCRTIVPSSGRIGVTSSARRGAGRHPDQRRRRRPAGGAVRPGLRRTGDGEEHLRHRSASCCSTSARRARAPTDGMLTTVAWTLADGTTHYALEGSIFVTGCGHPVAARRARTHRRRGRGRTAGGSRSTTPAACSSSRPSPASVRPWWDPYARGTIVGITRGTSRAHLARAVVESMAFQTRDVVDAMVAASGTPITDLRVDGGASAMDLLLSDPGRSARRDRAPARRPGDDGARRRVPRRAGRGRVADDRRHRRPRGRSTPSSRPAPTAPLADLAARRVAARRRALPRLGAADPSRRRSGRRVSSSGRPRAGRRARPAPARARGSDDRADRRRASAPTPARCTQTMSLGAESSAASRCSLPARKATSHPRSGASPDCSTSSPAADARATQSASTMRCDPGGRAPATRRRRSATRRPPRSSASAARLGSVRSSSTTRMLSTDTPSTASISAVSSAIRFSSGSDTIEFVDRPAGAVFEDLDRQHVAAHGADPARHLARARRGGRASRL